MKINLLFLPKGEFGLLFGEMDPDTSQDVLLAADGLRSEAGAKVVFASTQPLEPEGFAAIGDESHQPQTFPSLEQAVGMVSS